MSNNESNNKPNPILSVAWSGWFVVSIVLAVLNALGVTAISWWIVAGPLLAVLGLAIFALLLLAVAAILEKASGGS